VRRKSPCIPRSGNEKKAKDKTFLTHPGRGEKEPINRSTSRKTTVGQSWRLKPGDKRNFLHPPSSSVQKESTKIIQNKRDEAMVIVKDIGTKEG